METQLEITALAHGGQGVGRIEGRVCFVDYALPGDTVEVRVTRTTKNASWAEIVSVIEASPHRTSGVCEPHYCGSCAWKHFAYPAQLEWKQRIVGDCLKRIGRLEATVEVREAPELRLGYRTRAQFHGNGEHWGFFAPHSHDVVPVASCPLCHDELNKAFQKLKSLKKTGTVELTVNPEGTDVLVWSRKPVAGLTALFPQTQSLHDAKPRATFLFDGVPVVNGVFSQSSLLLNRLLVRTVRELTEGAGSILDLYCGNGNFTLTLPASVKVNGIDHSGAAIAAAEALRRGAYRTGKEEDFVRSMDKQHWDAIVLDPPRTGAKGLSEALGKAKTDAIVYVSCDPATLARDLAVLAAANWRLTRCVLVDMFPNTPHMETVCRLERKA
ncbi:MAG: class I SAM-dependent RNA methyltransferase [Candidatus Hydrogenedentes bacterium]|nr:class I SAM-dependent RNA methyltransferase [Candidatus Hydrogenedentota bacterium]